MPEMDLENGPGNEPEPQKLDEIKLDGAAVPENLRGKSVAELLTELANTQGAVQISERARLQAEQMAQALSNGKNAPPTPPEPEPEPELTDEQLAELHEKEPLKAIRYMQDAAIRRAERNLESRLGPMMQGTATQVEDAIRAKYPVEFELFGSEITKVAGSIPNAKANLSNPKVWEDVISMVRGRPENIDKLYERRQSAPKPPSRHEAQRLEQDSLGFSDNGRPSQHRTPANEGQLDATQKEIADKMNMSYADYAKWSKVGTGLD